jgi:serine/threonine protein kinase
VRALTAGSYDLQVQARTHDGRVSPTIAYHYRVLPYWHETGWVRALAAIVALLLFLLAARALAHWRTRRLKEANRRLEASVAERTSQLQEANQALNETNADLVASREQVIASSRRADLIFKALNDALAGTVLDDHYRIDQRIGSGGFGTVYRATELHMENVVAIKVFKPVPGHDAARSMERFRAEGHSAFLVNHPNAVRVLDFGICMDAVAYLVMEYLSGKSLAECLAEERVLAPKRVVRILRQASDVLAHAHEAGVIHRDVKPHNILLCEDHELEVVKLIDFGIAKVLDEATPNQLRNLTATGLLMGTPNYMAPERFLQDEYDGKSDVYSLGVIGYEMLCGTRPFPELGENYLPVALQHVNEAPPPLDTRVQGLAEPLVRFIMDMLAKHPGNRPTAQEAAHFFAALEDSMPEDDLAPAHDDAARGVTTAVIPTTPRKSRSR